MPEYKTEPLVVPSVSGLLPESERARRVALTSLVPEAKRVQVPTREVVCYECGKRSHVPTAALSAACVHCHAHLDMADVELRPGTRRLTLRTLGNVTIHPDAILSHLSIVCNNLTAHGRVSGDFQCSGRMSLGASSRIEGRVHVDTLAVEKGVSAVFANGVDARVVDVYGRLTGRVDASESVIIRRGGEVAGDCFCPDLVQEEGALLRGHWCRTDKK